MKVKLMLALALRCLLYGMIFFSVLGIIMMGDLKNGIIIGIWCSPSFLISGFAISALVMIFRGMFCKE